tara:strand:- start:72 stop:320 length:249 start_codon:yes stop_codon:yes gene_type:complete
MARDRNEYKMTALSWACWLHPHVAELLLGEVAALEDEQGNAPTGLDVSFTLPPHSLSLSFSHSISSIIFSISTGWRKILFIS